jgi:hypothetical protein
MTSTKRKASYETPALESTTANGKEKEKFTPVSTMQIDGVSRLNYHVTPTQRTTMQPKPSTSARLNYGYKI